MPDPEQTKVLFRFQFAYSNGEPVEVFDVDGEHASANPGIAPKVAVAGDVSHSDFDEIEWPEMLATAHDLFVFDPEAGDELLQWVKPEIMEKSSR